MVFLGDYNNDKTRVSRLNSDGSKDPSYHINTAFAGKVFKIAVGPDGKILVAGDFSYADDLEREGLARFNPDGTVDPTFDYHAVLQEAYGLAVLPDSRVVAMFESETINGVQMARLVRLQTDGSVDSSFDFIIPRAQTFTVQPDGKLLVGGGNMAFGGFARTGVMRINSNGTLDTQFNPGIATPNIQAVTLQPDGKILIGGFFTSVDGISRTHFARLNANGTLDQTFAGNSSARVSNIVRMSDGSVIVSAATNVRRYTSAGVLDPSFQAPDFNPVDIISDWTIRSMVALPNGSVLVAGSFDSPGNNLVVLKPNGNADNTFLPGGSNSRIESLAMAGRRILAGGYFKKIGGVNRLGIAAITQGSPVFDFDGDGKTDIGIFRPTGGEWWINRSGDGQTLALQFGSSTDKVAPADYTGDGKTDITFWRPSSGEWYVLRSEDNSFFSFPFGANGDIPAPADFDADGKGDFAVFRPSTGTWYIRRSTDGQVTFTGFGANGDAPIPADYDGDGRADVAIFRNNNGIAEWWINRSTAGLLAMQFGSSTDKAVPGDYTGDGRTDVAFWRPSTGEWYIVRSEDFSYFAFPFGANGDTPAPGDYDGDGKFDPTVFRPSSATWFIARSTAGTQIVQFGANGDRPLPNAFVP